MRLAFRTSYIGTDFFGSQMQPGRRTVEREFISACMNLGLFSDWREADFRFSGRTDRGVHARAQVCAFSTRNPERAVAALNKLLPPDCWCTGWAVVDDTFHPRFAAKNRTYRYYFFDKSLDCNAMQKAAEEFTGLHNFSRFSRPEGKQPERAVLYSKVFREEPFIVFEVRATGFLWNMVRCMAYALESAGRHEMTAEDIANLLLTPVGARLPANPPEGLVFWDADCSVTFAPLTVDERSRKYATGLRRRYALLKKVVEIL